MSSFFRVTFWKLLMLKKFSFLSTTCDQIIVIINVIDYSTAECLIRHIIHSSLIHRFTYIFRQNNSSSQIFFEFWLEKKLSASKSTQDNFSLERKTIRNFSTDQKSGIWLFFIFRIFSMVVWRFWGSNE